MPKRFTDTEKWLDTWFLELEVEKKIIFLYLCDKCDLSGVVEISYPLMSFFTKVPREDCERVIKDFGSNGKFIVRDGKILIKNFLEFQKNLPINPENRAHRSIITLLHKHLYLFPELKEIVGGFKGLQSPTGIGIGKGIGKGTSTSTSTSTSTLAEGRYITSKHFEEIWEEYPSKVGKKKSKGFFVSSVKTEKDLENIKVALKNYKRSKRVKDGFVQNASTWFNNWQDWVENPFKDEHTEWKARSRTKSIDQSLERI